MVSNRLLAGKVLPIKAILFNVFDPGFHLAFALRVIALTGMDSEPDRGGIRVKTWVGLDLPVLLVNHNPLGWVINTFFGGAAKIPEGFIMQRDEDESGRIQGLETRPAGTPDNYGNHPAFYSTWDQSADLESLRSLRTQRT